MKKITLHIAALLLLLLAPFAIAQNAKSADALRQETEQAETMYKAQNFFGALPLYKDLHEQDPKSTLYLEHYAMCVSADSQNRATSAEQIAQIKQALALFQQGRDLGNNSNFTQIMIEKLQQVLAESLKPAPPPTPAQVIFAKAEKAFSGGDLPGALVLYKQALSLDPKFYEAALYAGDTEFKQRHLEESEKWYAQATVIDPNRETAWRYWGDTLGQAGDIQGARAKFIQAIVADPYSNSTWIGLKQWAQAMHATLSSPEIKLPPPASFNSDAKNPTSAVITIDPSIGTGPDGTIWMPYVMGGPMWHMAAFHKQFPNETTYRHSLPEESQSLTVMLDSLKKKNTPVQSLSPTLQNLLALQKDGLLDAWILISGADEGIAKDYAAYRDAHRDLLAAYIDKYVIHQSN